MTDRKPTAAELDLLNTLWRLGPSTVKDVHQAMQDDKPTVTYANVLRLAQVMHGKGLLVRDETQRSHIYAAAQAQDALQTHLLTDFIQKAFAGSGKGLVLAALSAHVSDAERDEIRKLLDTTNDAHHTDQEPRDA